MLTQVAILMANILSILSFNIDTKSPVIIVNPNKSQNSSYFGYSVILFANDKEKWIKIGAPATAKHGIPNFGAVYKCPFKKECKEDKFENISAQHFDGNRLNAYGINSWIGGSMDISSKYQESCVSAFRWHQNWQQGKDFYIMNGAIFLENVQNKIQNSRILLRSDLQVVNKIFYYAYAAMGFSTHFPEDVNEIVLGAPGINNFVGSIVLVRNFNVSQVVDNTGDHYDLTGYSVTTGYFFKRNELLYAAGAPRATTKQETQRLLGIVTLFAVKNEINYIGEIKLVQKSIVTGTQVGEYFGFSLTAGDLNYDGFTDLIVGAPFRKNGFEGYNHGSIYVYYGNRNKETFTSKDRIDGSYSGAQFGTALMYLGDLDKNGFGDLAVSAPFEEDTGVVYIYAYRNNKLMLSQMILGKQIFPELRGFGVSFSRPVDIDDNGFQDIAIGAHISGHAVILRTKPIVVISAKFSELPTTLPREKGSFKFQACFSFSENDAGKIDIAANFTLDQGLGRAELDNQGTMNFTILNGKEKCSYIDFSVLRPKNFELPIVIVLKYRLIESNDDIEKHPIFVSGDEISGSDGFCSHCPLLEENRSSPLSIKAEMAWDQLCENNMTCASDLRVIGNFTNLQKKNIFVLGSDDSITLNIHVLNEGDPSFATSLEITLPSFVTLKKTPPICRVELLTNVTCDIGDNGEILSKNYSHTFEINMKDINKKGDQKELNFTIRALNTTGEQNSKNNIMLRLELASEADLLIEGESKEQSYFYEEEKQPIVNFITIFKIDKFGVSPVQQAQLQIRIPHAIRLENGSLKHFTNFVKYEGRLEDKSVTCSGNFDYFDNGKPENNISRNLDNSFTENSRTRRQVYEGDSLGSAAVANISNMKIRRPVKYTVFLNCSHEDVECATINCTIGPFMEKSTHAEITVEAELQTEVIRHLAKEKDVILLLSDAQVFVEGFLQTGNRSDFAEVSSMFVISRTYTIAVWIVIISAVFGFILLMVLVFCLYKAGFFNRMDHMKLENLKKEDLSTENELYASESVNQLISISDTELAENEEMSANELPVDVYNPEHCSTETL